MPRSHYSELVELIGAKVARVRLQQPRPQPFRRHCSLGRCTAVAVMQKMSTNELRFAIASLCKMALSKASPSGGVSESQQASLMEVGCQSINMCACLYVPLSF